MAASVASPFNELDVMLSDLSKGHYAASNSNDYSAYSDFGSFTKGTTPPNRPPPPREYKATVSVRSAESSSSKNLRRPPKPPKLQHVLTSGSRTHDLVKATPRYVKLRKMEHFWVERGRFCKSKMRICSFEHFTHSFVNLPFCFLGYCMRPLSSLSTMHCVWKLHKKSHFASEGYFQIFEFLRQKQKIGNFGIFGKNEYLNETFLDDFQTLCIK